MREKSKCAVTKCQYKRNISEICCDKMILFLPFIAPWISSLDFFVWISITTWKAFLKQIMEKLFVNLGDFFTKNRSWIQIFLPSASRPRKVMTNVGKFISSTSGLYLSTKCRCFIVLWYRGTMKQSGGSLKICSDIKEYS